MSEELPPFAFLSSAARPGFLRAPALAPQAHAPFIVAGVAWDGATTNRAGARHGPGAIRHASQMLCDATHPELGVSPLGSIADAGDLPLPNTSIERMRAALVPQARALLARGHVVWLGGDHSITLPLLAAYRAHCGRPLAVVHFDAHCDTWPDHAGEPSGHGTWVREAIDQGLADPQSFVQFGIRSAAAPEYARFVADRGGLIHTARELRGRESAAQLAEVIGATRTRLARVPGQPVYLSLDIDCLDPAFAPGTGTPEPGGLTSSQVLTLLEELRDLAWVGMDVCEVAPPYDHAELTSLAAAHFAWTYLCGRLSGKAR